MCGWCLEPGEISLVLDEQMIQVALCGFQNDRGEKICPALRDRMVSRLMAVKLNMVDGLSVAQREKMARDASEAGHQIGGDEAERGEPSRLLWPRRGAAGPQPDVTPKSAFSPLPPRGPLTMAAENRISSFAVHLSVCTSIGTLTAARRAASIGS